MLVRVLAFARLRDVLGFGERTLELPPDATLESLWTAVAANVSTADAFRASTRFARNGTLATANTALADGDEVALMPPVGGG